MGVSYSVVVSFMVGRKFESLVLLWLPFSSTKVQERTVLQHTKTQHSKLVTSYVLEKNQPEDDLYMSKLYLRTKLWKRVAT